MKASHLGMSVPKSPNFYPVVMAWISVFVPIFCKRKLL
ncbi:mCG147473 [Mus musculus]|nr:mCG147473 [Mus musculus]